MSPRRGSIYAALAVAAMLGGTATAATKLPGARVAATRQDAPGAVYLPVAHNGEAEPASPLGIQLSELRFRDPALMSDAAEAGVA